MCRSCETKFELSDWHSESVLEKLHIVINITPTVKYDCGSVILWGCFSSAGTENLVNIDIEDKWRQIRGKPGRKPISGFTVSLFNRTSIITIQPELQREILL